MSAARPQGGTGSVRWISSSSVGRAQPRGRRATRNQAPGGAIYQVDRASDQHNTGRVASISVSIHTPGVWGTAGCSAARPALRWGAVGRGILSEGAVRAVRRPGGCELGWLPKRRVIVGSRVRSRRCSSLRVARARSHSVIRVLRTRSPSETACRLDSPKIRIFSTEGTSVMATPGCGEAAVDDRLDLEAVAPQHVAVGRGRGGVVGQVEQRDQVGPEGVVAVAQVACSWSGSRC